jgi:hypothetical protein
LITDGLLVGLSSLIEELEFAFLLSLAATAGLLSLRAGTTIGKEGSITMLAFVKAEL